MLKESLLSSAITTAVLGAVFSLDFIDLPYDPHPLSSSDFFLFFVLFLIGLLGLFWVVSEKRVKNFKTRLIIQFGLVAAVGSFAAQTAFELHLRFAECYVHKPICTTGEIDKIIETSRLLGLALPLSAWLAALAIRAAMTRR